MSPVRRRSNPENSERPDFNSMFVPDLRALCTQNHLSNQGRRDTLTSRLCSFYDEEPQPAVAVSTGDQATNLSPTTNTMQFFNDAQLEQIKSLVTSSMQSSTQDIARQAAWAAINAMRNQPEEPLPRGPLTETTSLSPVIETPAQHEGLVAAYASMIFTVENSVIRLRNTSPSTTITDIDQWTTAFTNYMGIFIQKFPGRAQELLTYMSTIRYAARSHPGVAWAIMTTSSAKRQHCLSQSTGLMLIPNYGSWFLLPPHQFWGRLIPFFLKDP